MRTTRTLASIASGAAAALMLAACGNSAGAAHAGTTRATTTTQATATHGYETADQSFPAYKGSRVITLQSPNSYTPHAPKGGFDDYHCTVVNPHLTQNSYIVGSHFIPNSLEVHHAILFEVLPNAVPQAVAEDNGGKGWTCFGDFGIGRWLAVWAPGHGLDMAPKGTGFYFPKGSMVIMQVHYNLLEGDKPTHVKLELQTVPAASAHLIPLNIDPIPAPPDIPCPAGLHGPLCNRAASLAELGRQFGPSEVAFVDQLEQACGRNPQDPPSGDTTSCTVPLGFAGEILRIQPHMHLLGTGMKVTLNPGTPHARVLLNDTSYDFNYQRSFNMPKPVVVTPNDTVQVQCTYDPKLEEELPQLRTVPPHFVTWGDGSSDEMCLGILSWIASPGASSASGQPG